MMRIVANQRETAGAATQSLRETVPTRVLANGQIGEDEFLLFDGKSHEHAFGFFNRAADVHRAIARFDEFGDARERRIGRVNNERERLGHERLIWRRCGRQNNHVLERIREKLSANPRWCTKIVAGRDDMFGNKLWVKTRKRDFVLDVKRVEQVGHGLFGKFQAVGIANTLENFLEFLYRWRIDLHLVMHAAQLRRIHQLLRRKVRCKYYQLIE